MSDPSAIPTPKTPLERFRELEATMTTLDEQWQSLGLPATPFLRVMKETVHAIVEKVEAGTFAPPDLVKEL